MGFKERDEVVQGLVEIEHRDVHKAGDPIVGGPKEVMLECYEDSLI